jgi:fermentation-respiration switch protein FrsA (DUF1100 family)
LFRMLLIAVFIAALWTLLFLVGGMYFYSYSIQRRKKEFLQKDPDLRESKSGAVWNSNREWLQQQPKEELCLTMPEGLSLSALYLPCPGATKTAIIVHGYNSWNGSMGGFAQYLLETLGYHVLLPDCRGHGKSQGGYIGFGWHDRKDMLQWIDLLLQKKGADTQILLYGVSMGGSTVLMTGGEELPHNVKCIIADCAYSSVTGILSYQMKRMFKLPSFPLMSFTSLICRLRAGYSFKEASALKQVAKARLPILFIHGSEDRFVPTSMVYELYEAADCPKELLVVEGAAHGTSFWKNPQDYKAAVEAFLEKYMTSSKRT